MIGYHQCPTCITDVPDTRTLCYFCSKEQPLGTKECLRCRRARPVDEYAGNGKYRVCDDCRWMFPMTEDEQLRSKRLSGVGWRNRHLRVERLKDRNTTGRHSPTE
jgi:hypothetical protein